MTSRERLTRVIKRQDPDRIGLHEIEFWPETLCRWQEQGLPAGGDPNEILGMDLLHRIHVDNGLGLETRLVEETADYRIESNGLGVTAKVLKSCYGPPQELDHLVKNEDDWLRYRERLVPSAERLTEGERRRYREAATKGAFVVIQTWSPVWFVFHLIGYYNALICIGEAAAWIEKIMADYSSFLCRQVETLEAEGIALDGIWLNADLCTQRGMVFSPAYYRQVAGKYDHLIARLCRERGIPLFLHCCGRVADFLPLLVEVGYDVIQPLQAGACNDLCALKQRYGQRLTFMGNISPHALSGTRDDIERELRGKIPAAKKGGGYVFASDHAVVPEISLDSYRFAVELARELGSY